MRWLDERVELRALLAGVAADWIGTFLTAPLLALAFGLTPENAASRIPELLASPGYLSAAIAHGALFTGLGGWVAARLAPGDELRHAAIVGALAIVLAVTLSLTPAEGPAAAWWVAAAGYLLALPSAGAGGWLARYRRRGW